MEVVEFVDPAKRRGSREDDKRIRKLFMSSKAADVLKEETTTSKMPLPRDGDEEFFVRDIDLSSIFRGVERIVGNSHLSWKEKKKLEQERAEALGAKPVKNSRVPIYEGKLIQKKRQREEAKKQDLELPRKKTSKNKKRNKGKKK